MVWRDKVAVLTTQDVEVVAVVRERWARSGIGLVGPLSWPDAFEHGPDPRRGDDVPLPLVEGQGQVQRIRRLVGSPGHEENIGGVGQDVGAISEEVRSLECGNGFPREKLCLANSSLVRHHSGE